MAKKIKPLGIRLLVLINIAGAALIFILLVKYLIFPGSLEQAISHIDTSQLDVSPDFLYWSMIVVAIFTILFSLLMAWAIWNLKNWARIVTVVFAFIGLFTIFNLLGEPDADTSVNFIISLVEIYILIFDKETKAAFK